MIRLATRQDIPKLIELMRGYANESPVDIYKDINFQNTEYVSNLFFSIIIGRGFILVDDDVNGMLVAIKTQNIWSPDILELKELAWWVKPEYRKGSLGGKLWIEFNYLANEMIKENKIQIVTSSLMVNSPKLDYEKRGFRLLESTYIKE